MTERYDVVRDTIMRHRKRTIQACDCGWAEVGRDHAEHLALAIEAALVMHAVGHTDLDEIDQMVRSTLKLVES